MAIYPKFSAQAQTNPPQPPNIEAWTEQAAQSLSAISLSNPSGAGGILTPLSIPLDEHPVSNRAAVTGDVNEADEEAFPTYRSRREPLRRDSLKRRDALLKGKEGSRRRQRWENDRLLNNPWAQPPLPIDWEIHPTYPKRSVPYYLAPLWDANLAARNAADKKRVDAARKLSPQEEESLGKVPKELRDKLKKAKAAKGLLQDLEEQVRKFVKKWEKKAEELERAGLHDLDSEDEEIVFVGRNGQMHDFPASPPRFLGNTNHPRKEEEEEEEEVKRDQLVFDSLVDDHGASFGRWLVHSIASYYGLRTWSITVGDPARREAYVGIKRPEPSGRPVTPSPVGGRLPRPLWGMV